MRTTPTSSTEEKTAALAVALVALHAHEHQLLFNEISTPSGSTSGHLRVRVSPTDFLLWLDKLRKPEQRSVRPLNSFGSPWETVVYAGQVDSAMGSVEVEVSTTRKVVSPVRAVSSAVAS